jgi:hypothetical protein
VVVVSTVIDGNACSGIETVMGSNGVNSLVGSRDARVVVD